MRCLQAVSLALLAVAAPLRAQEPVSPDQTREDVIARLGAPAAERASGELTFLFYESACAPQCPLSDVVILRSGRVVDALVAPRGSRTAASELGEVEDFGANTLRAVEPLYFYVDPTLHAARPLVARPYRLPGSFGPGDIEEFERAQRGGAGATTPDSARTRSAPPGAR
jgi:hypothetical protein